MDHKTCSNTLRGVIQTTFPDKLVAYDNAPYESPDASTTWLRVEVKYASTNLTERGSVRHSRVHGFLAVEIYTPLASGDSESLVVAKKVIDAVHLQMFSTIYMHEAGVVGSGRDGAWWKTTVITDFYFDTQTGALP